jgi:hypothetical protein
VVEVKRLILLITLVVTLVALVISDVDTFLADSNIPDNEMTISQIEASNSSTSATITITMYATLLE